MPRPRIALALGSGSARGWAHIGVIDALNAAGIEPEIVCGTSMGALVGAAYATGRLDKLRAWAEVLTWRDVVALMDVSLSAGGLMNGRLVVALLRELGVSGPIENCPKRYAAIATDLVNGREIWLQSGSIEDAVRSSIALPGIFSPIRFRDTWLIDGGLSNPVPVSACRALGADIIVAVNLNGDLLGRRFEAGLASEDTISEPRDPTEFIRHAVKQMPPALRAPASKIAGNLLQHAPSTPGYFDVIANSINIMQDHITRSRLAGEPPHVMLAPRLHQISLMQFNRAKEAIEEGRTCVEHALPMLRHLV